MHRRLSKTFVMCLAMLSMSFYLGATAFASDDINSLLGREKNYVAAGNFVAGDALYETLSVAVANKYNNTIMAEVSVTSPISVATGAYKEEEVEEKTSKFDNIGLAITKKYINIRSSANANAKVVGKLYNGAFVSITQKSGDWCKIESGKVIGFVPLSQLKTGDEAETIYDDYVQLKATIKATVLNLREEKSTESKSLAQLKKGEKYRVLSQEEEWVQISVDGKHGYVSSEYVTVKLDFVEAISIEEEQALIAAEAQKKLEDSISTSTSITYGSETVITDAEFRLFVCLIYAESGGESYQGKLGVANVILNRLHSSKFPNTIKGVVYQKSQFGPVTDGALAKQLANYDAGKFTGSSHKDAINAAKAALDGKNNIGNRLFFNGYNTEKDEGHANALRIENHLFW